MHGLGNIMYTMPIQEDLTKRIIVILNVRVTFMIYNRHVNIICIVIQFSQFPEMAEDLIT